MGAPNLRWGGFQNGRIPREHLVDIGGGKLLQRDAWAGLSGLMAEFRDRWGARLYLDIYQDAYRDIARQRFMLEHPELYPHAHAAVGTSVHGWARSVDVTGYGAKGSARHIWLVENAPRFGWSWDYGRQLGESWHFDYLGPITTTAGDGTEPFPLLIDDPIGSTDMPLVLLKQSTAGKAAEGGATFCLYDPSAQSPEARWQEFSEYGLARSLVDALHNRRKDAAEASAVVLPDYAWDVWKARAVAAPTVVTGGVVVTAAENADAVAEKLASSFAAIPTAEQNGAAARAAIVKG
jgi:hypothetical protein